MLPIYKKKVLDDYLEKRLVNKFSTNLTHPTPDSLREECLEAVRRVLLKKDEAAIKSFFKPESDIEPLIWWIQRFDLDKFRPLVKYMRKETKDTDSKNVALLAWLIDFEPRPYQLELYVNSEIETNAALQEVDSEKETELNSMGRDEELDEKEQSKDGTKNEIQTVLPEPINLRKGLIKPAFYLFWGLVASGSVYLLVNNMVGRSVFNAFFANTQERCMYWTGDHYEPISCNQKLKDVQILALDTLKTTRFKRITKPDTLTKKSLGTVWYSKIDNSVEFYTSGGYHPVRIERRLKPLTEYVLDKYVGLQQK